MSSASPSPSATMALPRKTVVAWRNAVFATFALNGVGLASWMARVPVIRDALGASTTQMGWIVFSIASGSIVGLTLASHVLARVGSRATITGCVVLGAAGLAVIGVGSSGSARGWLVVLGLALLGLGMGMCDVAMNVEGAAVERELGRTVMPLFHAAFSGGTVLGAVIGALSEYAAVPTWAHFSAIAIVLVVGILWYARYLHLDAVGAAAAEADPDATTPGWRERLAMWADRRTLLIGLIVLGMAFAEGSANDWLALAMVDGHGVANSTGAVIYGVFVTAMTIGRVVGVRVLDRFGRVPVLRGSALLAAVGLLAVIFVPQAPLASVAVVAWGFGSALGFPVGMSAAADDSRTATARVSVVATIGYLAFLVGPPSIGFLGGSVGLLKALLLVLVLVAVAGVASPAARERGDRPAA
jgi:MFS family permease